jgi:hypothetical protein
MEAYMNKKVFVVFLLAAALVILGLGSCQSYNRPIDRHNSRLCLDWEGVYSGTIMTSDGRAIVKSLRLNADQSFEMNLEYPDRAYDPINLRGNFKWDETGSIIYIDVIDSPTYYKVAQSMLIELDEDGKPLIGKYADNYLAKIKYWER